jgi:thymidylate kinase
VVNIYAVYRKLKEQNMIIFIDGNEGSGKGTAIRMIKDLCPDEAKVLPMITYLQVGREAIAEAYKDPASIDVAALIVDNHLCMLSSVIPSMNAADGKSVIVDRSPASFYVYQLKHRAPVPGTKFRTYSILATIAYEKMHKLMEELPDSVYVWLDAAPEICRDRAIARGDMTEFDKASLDLYRERDNLYARFYANYRGAKVMITNNGTEEELLAQIKEKIKWGK